MQNKMNVKNKTHKCVPRNSQINLSVQEFEKSYECILATLVMSKRIV